MADGKKHRRIGQLAGTGFALYRAREQEPFAALFEAAGGFYGGKHGAALHDVLEPATTPDHRGIGHSIGANGATIFVATEPFEAAQQQLRSWAREHEQRALAPEPPFLETLLHLLGAASAHVLVGYMNGFAAGAVSHLALDFPTAKGIPLLVKGF